MNEVRVLVMTNFTYSYTTSSYKNCGDSMYFNPSSLEQLEELKFILDSSYMKKGWLYVENSIKEDFKNKVGIFAEKTTISKQTAPSEEEIIQEITVSLEYRKSQLEAMKASEVKVVAEGLGLEEYTNKTAAIEYILEVEYKQ